MGHDHHFLERLDRVQTSHVEAALGLYRDHEAVRFVLDELALPEKVERVALSLGTKRGPFVVLARNGHFVTCLAEGMTTGNLMVVPHERLEALLGKHQDLKGREHVRKLVQRKNESANEFLIRMFRRGEALTREELIAFSAFQPLMGRMLYKISLDASRFVIDNLRKYVALTTIKPAQRQQAKLFHDELWLAGHTLLLGTMGERAELDEFIETRPKDKSPTLHTSWLSSTTLLLRGAWAAARLGKGILPTYRHSLATSESAGMALDGTLAVLAVAFADPSAKSEAKQILETIPTHADEGIAQTRKMLSGMALAVLEDPESTGRLLALEVGRDLMFQKTRHLDEGDPYRYAAKEDVPDDVATTSVLVFDTSWNNTQLVPYLFASVPLLANARAEVFYFPREIARRVVPEWTPEATLELAARFKNTVALAQEPTRKEGKVGRNEPCPCGSGKKYKKCHGA